MYIETFISELLRDLNRRLNQNIRSYQRSNTTQLGLFLKNSHSSSNQASNNEYVSTIRNIFPKIFANTFEFDDYSIGPRRMEKQMPVQVVESTMSSTRMYLNEAKIINKLNAIHRYGENEFVHKWVGLAQNLPFYITISYLLTRYVFKF